MMKSKNEIISYYAGNSKARKRREISVEYVLFQTLLQKTMLNNFKRYDRWFRMAN